jgi:hypothetical protein
MVIESEGNKMTNEELVLRMNILGGMNTFVIEHIGDEDILEGWLTFGVQDQATEEDLRFIAEDDECFADVCAYFGKIVKRGLTD